jgi:transposase
MRGSDERSGELFSYVDLEDRVPTRHPLRLIRRIVNDVLVALNGEFAQIYADSGRPSISASANRHSNQLLNGRPSKLMTGEARSKCYCAPRRCSSQRRNSR